MPPLAERALSYLDTKPLALFNDQEQRLMGMMLTFANVSLAVEVQRHDEAAHTRLRAHLRILRASADTA